MILLLQLLLVYSICGNLSSRFSFVASAETLCVDTRTGRHYLPPCEDNVYSPPISPKPTQSPTPIPTTSPTTTATTNSTMTPGGNSTTTPGGNSTMTTPGPTSSPVAFDPVDPSPTDDDGEDGEGGTNGGSTDGDNGDDGDGDGDGSKCVSEGGIFGNISGPPLTVSFGYELTVIAGADVEDDVLPALEQDIVDGILYSLFDGNCRRQRMLYSSMRAAARKLTVVGISRNPTDDIIDDVTCEVPPADGHDCMVVNAALTLYMDATVDDEDFTDEEEAVKEHIEMKMDQGDYNDVHEDVVSVVYVELANTDNGGANNSEGGAPDQTEVSPQDTTRLRVGVFVAAGLFSALLIGVAYQRRRKNNASGDDGETELGTAPPNQDAPDLPEQDTDMSDVYE